MPPSRVKDDKNDGRSKDEAFLMDYDVRVLHKDMPVARERHFRELEQKYHQRKRQRSDLQPEFLLITGQPGTGKTLLAKFLEPVVMRDNGYFLSGQDGSVSHSRLLACGPNRSCAKSIYAVAFCKANQTSKY